jgi:DNA mismatch repair protein MutL
MGRIQILDLHTVNQIAAGEVIERPASIVKELFDNALDARATRLTLDLEAGGHRLIRLMDDGTGMPPEDLPLAVTNHATSKLHHLDDLQGLGTLGFRGEALAAIAAVSRLSITSREAAADVAHRIEVVDGISTPVRPVAASPGTTIVAAEVFYNTPARREFLRSPAAERRAILDVVVTYALAQPQLRLLVRDDGREILDLQPAATLRERAAELMGRPVEQNLVEVASEIESMRVEGLASRPPYGRPNRSQQYLFVNGRPVRDRAVLFAVAHAYQRAMEPDRFPVVVLSLTLPGDQLDPNVHPTKREVRFRNERLLHRVVVAALGKAVGPVQTNVALPAPPSALAMFRHLETAAGGPMPPLQSPAFVSPELGFDTGMDLAAAAPEGAAVIAETPPRRADVGDDALYWQLHNAYVMVQIKGGMVIVDQHAAHERVLYDRAVAALEGRHAAAQRLLFPIALELSVRQFAAFEEASPLLESLGFQVRPFGGQSVLVEGIPAEMHNWEEGAVLLGMLDDVAENRDSRRLPLRDKVLATFACRGAIMQGKRLAVTEMRALMDQLFATTLPYTCPHGRPTLMRIGLQDLDRKFQRS